MKTIMIEKNDLDHNVEGDAVEGAVEAAGIHDVVLPLKMTIVKAHAPRDISFELMAASREIQIQVVAEQCPTQLSMYW